MDYSILLATSFGIFLLIAGAKTLFDPQSVREITMYLVEHRFMRQLLGWQWLFFGTILVCSHSVWVLDARLFVTMMCYWVLIKSVILMWSPKAAWMAHIAEAITNFRVLSGFYLGLGLFYLWLGWLMN